MPRLRPFVLLAALLALSPAAVAGNSDRPAASSKSGGKKAPAAKPAPKPAAKPTPKAPTAAPRPEPSRGAIPVQPKAAPSPRPEPPAARPTPPAARPEAPAPRPEAPAARPEAPAARPDPAPARPETAPAARPGPADRAPSAAPPSTDPSWGVVPGSERGGQRPLPTSGPPDRAPAASPGDRAPGDRAPAARPGDRAPDAAATLTRSRRDGPTDTILTNPNADPRRPHTAVDDRPRPDGRRPAESRPDWRPVHRTEDHRYARPAVRHVVHHHVHHHHAHYPPPYRYHYVPYYTHWWVHPYYRYQHATVAVIGFGFWTDPWVDYWVPQTRPGWVWVPGYYLHGGYWYPGYWAPVAPAPVGYAYVPGFWDGGSYVEGYYRTEQREGDWRWVEGYYLEDGTYVWGNWEPTDPGPEGYTWEAGFWDGETYIEGFWRPEFRAGYTWVTAYYDESGIFHGGYWMPTEARTGQVWIPGWFDGNEWVDGYWVDEQEYQSVDPATWEPEAEWDGGWEVGRGWGDGEVLTSEVGAYEDGDIVEDSPYVDVEDQPLALPVNPD